jgi:hypothetical protein
VVGGYNFTFASNIDGQIYAKKFQRFDQSMPNELGQMVEKNRFLMKCIIEYCQALLASSLNIGPHICTDSKFDLVCYSDGVEFEIELYNGK